MAKIIPFPNNGNGHTNQGDTDGADHHVNSHVNDDFTDDGYPVAAASESQESRKRFPGLFHFDLGLSEDQIAALLAGDAEARSRIFEVSPRLTPEDAARIPVLRHTIALLESVSAREPLKATAKGNLPQAVVKELIAGAFADAEPAFIRVNREGDSMALSRARRMAQNAGLLRYRNREFRLTKAARTALSAGDHNELYRRLLESHLKRPQLLAQYDRVDDGGATGAALPLLLFAARDPNAEWLFEEDAAELILELGMAHFVYPDELEHAIYLRFFERFGVAFGLFEEGPPFEPHFLETKWRYLSRSRWRRTEIFDRVFQWHAEPPPRAVLRPEVAASMLMTWVHESGEQIDGNEYSSLRHLCVRAIERCPTHADAYVVLARTYEQQPERALTIADAGLAATADKEPDFPPGWAAWDDHLFRDVMRLHFIRAETLLTLDRRQEAVAAFEHLLSEYDPDDRMGATDSYVPALIISGHHRAAKECLKRISETRRAAPLWNRLLTHLALGEESEAEKLLPEALERNSYIPELLSVRPSCLPYPLPDYYSPGSPEEAVLYASAALEAWRTVPRARQWVQQRL